MDRQPLSAGATSDAAMVESNEKLGGPKRSKIAGRPWLLGVSISTPEAQKWNGVLLA